MQKQRVSTGLEALCFASIIMARLDGQKKSTAPILVAILAVAALALGAYYLRSRNQPTAGSVGSSPPVSIGTVVPTPDAAGNEASSDATASNKVPSDATAVDNSASVTPDAGPESTPEVTPSANLTTPGNTPDSTSGSNTASSENEALKDDVVAKRSKTITGKDGTTVTYSKEVHRDGAVTKNKTTGTSLAKP